MDGHGTASQLSLAGKVVGSPIVVFPDNICGGSYVVGTLANVAHGLIAVAVGTATLNGVWYPVAPFIAGDLVFIPTSAIDAFV